MLKAKSFKAENQERMKVKASGISIAMAVSRIGFPVLKDWDMELVNAFHGIPGEKNGDDEQPVKV